MSAPGPGQLLFAFVRHWSRRSTAGDASVADLGRLVLVTEAVAALVGRDEPATVNAVADEIGIDQSGASRLIKSAVGAGYVTMTTAPSDGRRREAAVTSIGHTALREAHAWQERIFDELTAGWSPQRRDDFQSAMADLIARSSVVTAVSGELES
ncbi:MarR family winged helix-turn-helix transcriptional regulator [Streptomyces sp. NBC_01808]|uniref:MarR family winged helix-turn-helix transcriptional regulator n=1 Tax=Streptomyces sp. NBC_01808 TaxID=2975947 RepID=UPI002DDC867D|nr:MarR family winged helix-turn-helix transcriptional regulator [Streptomyces sp. NBC_01808]WSA41560.1 MarR family winged helix-turn-helix transcriptional regulator [Streptomyces sp. NBC_01808]